MMKTDLVSNLPSGMQERVNNTGSDTVVTKDADSDK